MSRYQLRRDDRGLALFDHHLSQKPLRVDFTTPDFLNRLQHAGKKSELVARAVGAKPDLQLLDCTAGLAVDSFILAHLGCEVTLIERSRTLACLLEDGLTRAKGHPLLEQTVSRISLHCADAKDYLASTPPFDVVYMDPMFPEKHGSAAVRGSMQILQRFLGPDDDAQALLECALGLTVRRVVIKRPVRSNRLVSVKPSHVHTSRNARFEVFLRP